jgi:uncharacterized 2Fe-2S/4Fe-4S cluster protein (DUF4445 family)
MSRVRLVFSPTGRRITVKQGTNVLNAAIEAGVTMRTECGGNGICGKCKIIVKEKGALNALTDAEKKRLTLQQLKSGYRLACQTTPKQNVEVVIPKESRVGELRVLAYGLERQTALNPLVRKFHVKLRRPSLADVTPDLERLLAALKDVSKACDLSIDYATLRRLPDVLREADWNVTATLWDNKKVISLEPGDTTNVLFGFAVDVGTSKIVGHLVDLNNGRIVATHYVENPQLTYGADIITRIAFAIESEANLQTLQNAVVEGINRVLASACAEAKVEQSHVYEAVLVGNTAMHHLCLGIQPRHTALSPYVPALKGMTYLRAEELGVRMNPTGIVGFLPIIAGFVGADAVADVLATSFHRLKRTSLLMDIGTNTELFVGDSRDILSCSCASGPAFEGARIKHGMRAEVGAIESVCIRPDFGVEFRTIGNVEPVGLCGSAMIDAVAEMFKRGVVDFRGRFNVSVRTDRLRKSGNQTEFVVARACETATKKDIVVTQKDVGEIQLAKAAVYAGCSVLMDTKNVDREKLDRIFIAGAFGRYINPENAKFLGLVPDVPSEKIEFVGNTALAGARMALVSKRTREAADDLSREVRYLELATAAEFNRELAQAMFIPHRDMKRFPSVEEHFRKT